MCAYVYVGVGVSVYLCAVYVEGILHILLLHTYFRSKVLHCTATLLVVLCCYKKIYLLVLHIAVYKFYTGLHNTNGG